MADFATKTMADIDDDDDDDDDYKVDETEATKTVAGDDNGVYVNDTSIVMMNKPDGRFCNKNNG